MANITHFVPKSDTHAHHFCLKTWPKCGESGPVCSQCDYSETNPSIQHCEEQDNFVSLC